MKRLEPALRRIVKGGETVAVQEPPRLQDLMPWNTNEFLPLRRLPDHPQLQRGRHLDHLPGDRQDHTEAGQSVRLGFCLKHAGKFQRICWILVPFLRLKAGFFRLFLDNYDTPAVL